MYSVTFTLAPVLHWTRKVENRHADNIDLDVLYYRILYIISELQYQRNCTRKVKIKSTRILYYIVFSSVECSIILIIIL